MTQGAADECWLNARRVLPVGVKVWMETVPPECSPADRLILAAKCPREQAGLMALVLEELAAGLRVVAAGCPEALSEAVTAPPSDLRG